MSCSATLKANIDTEALRNGAASALDPDSHDATIADLEIDDKHVATEQIFPLRRVLRFRAVTAKRVGNLGYGSAEVTEAHRWWARPFRVRVLLPWVV
jgi:hypothetical protein